MKKICYLFLCFFVCELIVAKDYSVDMSIGAAPGGMANHGREENISGTGVVSSNISFLRYVNENIYALFGADYMNKGYESKHGKLSQSIFGLRLGTGYNFVFESGEAISPYVFTGVVDQTFTEKDQKVSPNNSLLIGIGTKVYTQLEKCKFIVGIEMFQSNIKSFQINDHNIEKAKVNSSYVLLVGVSFDF